MQAEIKRGQNSQQQQQQPQQQQEGRGLLNRLLQRMANTAYFAGRTQRRGPQPASQTSGSLPPPVVRTQMQVVVEDYLLFKTAVVTVPVNASGDRDGFLYLGALGTWINVAVLLRKFIPNAD